MTEQSLEEFLVEEPQPVNELEALSRRKFLTGAVVGGAAGVAVAAGTGVAVWKVADAELLAAKEAAEAELQAIKEAADAELQTSRAAAEAEIALLQGLIDLYEGLEKIGLDAILATGMKAVALPLAAVEAGARALKGGLDWAEEALLSLEEALPTAQESLLWLEAQVSAVADGIEKLEASVAKALGKATDNPVAEALRDFSNMVLDNLPFGLGDRIRDVLDGMVDLVTNVDELIEGINTYLLEPLRQKWFSTEDGEGIGSILVDPLIEHVLDPVEAHLTDLAVLADSWQNDLMAPTQKALAERAKVHEEIARYKQEHGLG